ncbi:vha-15 [Symbiodinium necroappetens]|uniref:V-type proton ATPase subunit H n=1 Tax=Symbiodinium necroappetens TaxID=1628268 RepID=A0A812LG52_9DINO|nr:vha-15 [Symbiodinium necroappetens]
MAEAASLIEKYRVDGGVDLSKAAEIHNNILSFKPEWESYEATKSSAHILKLIEADAPAIKNKSMIQGHIQVLQACMALMGSREDKPIQWLLTLFYDMLREDSSGYAIFEDATKQRIEIYKPLLSLLQRPGLENYTSDKVAWLLSAVMSHVPHIATEASVKEFLGEILDSSKTTCSELGQLEAITNLLKGDVYRKLVWSSAGIPDRIFRIQPKSSPSPHLYKCIFAIWALSFDPQITSEMKEMYVIKKLKETLMYSRVEKVVRLCLTVLKNFLSHKSMCEDIVEEGILEAVQQLEFEKWRDAELYDDIKEMAIQIGSEVSEMSNYERYERELQTGKLQWGFIHSSKFWAENVMKFESNDFRALKMLASLLQSPSTDATTLAVACHDLGEFVTLHPLGKKKVAQLQVKEKVMQLMAAQDPNFREVRREALLCCQKIMLNKWQACGLVAWSTSWQGNSGTSSCWYWQTTQTMPLHPRFTPMIPSLHVPC